MKSLQEIAMNNQTPLKIRSNLRALLIAAGLCTAFILSGCAQPPKPERANYGGNSSAATAPVPATAKPPEIKARPEPTRSEKYGPSHTTYEADGIKWISGSMAFPSGRLESSGLLLQKIVPAEAVVGSTFTYRYEVMNLTPYDLQQVMVSDRISSNFSVSSADPRPASVNGGLALWNLDTLGPHETKIITVTGSSPEEGTVTTCGWATYSPILCAPIRILKPGLELTKRMTPDATICDPIQLTITVHNSGNSALHDIVVVDELPAGLANAEGHTSLRFVIGTLPAGESKVLPVVLKAARTGKFDNVAKVTCKEGLTREATASTTLRQAQLQLSCVAPPERYVGRGADFCFKISNNGDAACGDAVIEVPLPPRVTVQSTTGGGTTSGGKLMWRIGPLSAGESKEVCATLVTSTVGQLAVNAIATCGCVTPATAACETSYRGIGFPRIDVSDSNDPIQVGANETYEITVTNQGSAPLTNVKLTSKLDATQEFLSGTGDSAVAGSGGNVDYAPIASIAPKTKVSWKVIVRVLKAGDARFSTTLSCDQTERPVEESESTRQF